MCWTAHRNCIFNATKSFTDLTFTLTASKQHAMMQPIETESETHIDLPLFWSIRSMSQRIVSKACSSTCNIILANSNIKEILYKKSAKIREICRWQILDTKILPIPNCSTKNTIFHGKSENGYKKSSHNQPISELRN